MFIEDFNRTIDSWINEIDRYTFVQLCTKPALDSWSLGQVYMHLIDTTNYFIEQIKICLSTNENAMEEATPTAKNMFLHNDFPNELLEGPPSNAQTPQPNNKVQLRSGLINIKAEITHMAISISTSPFRGKTKHPGLNYFNAYEWLQFTAMHFRHHLRQKKRLDDFLKTNNY